MSCSQNVLFLLPGCCLHCHMRPFIPRYSYVPWSSTQLHLPASRLDLLYIMLQPSCYLMIWYSTTQLLQYAHSLFTRILFCRIFLTVATAIWIACNSAEKIDFSWHCSSSVYILRHHRGSNFNFILQPIYIQLLVPVVLPSYQL